MSSEKNRNAQITGGQACLYNFSILNSQFYFRSSILISASRWIIAYSGGIDSHVLLYLAKQAAEQQNKTIVAVHINHGLNPKAAEWARHCQTVCADLHIPCQVIKVKVQLGKGKSVEAAAREARYQAFAAIVQKEDVLLTAHHQDDQAETLLLQLLRGAGVKGLAAMGSHKEHVISAKAGIQKKLIIYRPLLNISRADILAYAGQHTLQWIHDDSNDNVRFDRNFLRHKILPLLNERWPTAKQNIARSSQHCAEADELLMQLGRQDYQLAAMVKKLHLPEFLETGIIARLNIPALLDLSAARQKNALRTWFTDLNVLQPSEAKLMHIRQDVLLSRDDSNPEVSWEAFTIRRFNDELYLCHTLPDFNRDKIYQWDLQSEIILPIGKISMAPSLQEDYRVTALMATTQKINQEMESMDDQFEIKFRQGGERFHPAGRAHSQTLKKLFQEWQIPNWLRDRIPLLYYKNELIAVLGYALSDILASRHEN